MAARLLTTGLRGLYNNGARVSAIQIARSSSGGAKDWGEVIGGREVVGHGFNGEPIYMDRVDFPMPAIRYKENTPDIQCLREKEKGDWRQLSVEEKKTLYRASFCQTLSELKANTGRWKSTIGFGLFFVSCGIWVFLLTKMFVYEPLPDEYTEENQKKQLRLMLDLRVNPINGISSKWDYEKDDWKK